MPPKPCLLSMVQLLVQWAPPNPLHWPPPRPTNPFGRAVDLSGNGTVGATELYHLFERMGNPISYEKLVRVFEVYDVDDTGEAL